MSLESREYRESLESLDSGRDILEMRAVDFSYTEEPFIRGLDLGVRDGDFIALLGANGSGKSTLLRLLSGILPPEAGDMALWSKAMSSYRNRDRAKLVSFLPQTLDMGVPFTVEELAGMGLYPYEAAHGKRGAEAVEEALEMVGLTGKREAVLGELSGGEKRRAYIAMTLLQGAGILLLDEPLANLDIRYQLELIRLLRELNATRRISIVMALHEINLAMRFDRVVLVKEGGVLADGTPGEVLTEGLLMEAFGVDVRIREDAHGAYISYD